MSDMTPTPTPSEEGQPSIQWWKRKIFWIPAAVFLVLLVISAIAGEREDEDAAPSTATSTTSVPTETDDLPDEPTTTTADEPTPATDAPTTTEATTTTEAASEDDEAQEFLDMARSNMELFFEDSLHRYIVDGRISGSFLIVDAQLTRDDQDTADRLCGALLSESYAKEWSFDRIDIMAADGGSAARCEQNPYLKGDR